MPVDLLHPRDLSSADRAAWIALRATEPAYASPFFHPAFAEDVGAVRDDARVALVRQDGRLVAVWPHHRRPLGYVRAIGAPLSDWHGPIVDPGCALDGDGLLAAIGGAATRMIGLADPQRRFASAARAEVVAYVADLGEGVAAYKAWQERERSHHAKELRRRARKVEREVGPLRAVIDCRDPGVFEILLTWKRAQYAATGRHDVLASPWVRALLDRLRAREDDDFRAVVHALFAGDRLMSAELFLRSGAVKHSWFPAYDPAFATYGPGHLLNAACVEAAEGRGYSVIEFGSGHDEYKRLWANRTLPMIEAVVHAPTIAGRARGAAEAAWAGLEAGPAPLAGKLRRRLDQAAAAEVSWRRALNATMQRVAGRV